MIQSAFKNWQTMMVVAEMTFRLQIMDSFIMFGIVIQPLLIATLAMWMLQGKGADAAIYVVVGSGMTGLWSCLLFVSGNSINDERWTGTLESVDRCAHSIGCDPLGEESYECSAIDDIDDRFLSLCGIDLWLSHAAHPTVAFHYLDHIYGHRLHMLRVDPGADLPA